MKSFEDAIFIIKGLKIDHNNKYALVGIGDAYRGLKK